MQKIVIDDRFPTKNGEAKFVRVAENQSKNGEIFWPLLIEKAYSKLHGSFAAIEGGWVDEACADITNGAPGRFCFEDDDVKKMIDTG
jgi:hypothetical protein